MPAFYKKVASESAHSLKAQAANGQWFEIAELTTMIRERFAVNNDAFAKEVWGCGWSELFPSSDPIPNTLNTLDVSEAERPEFDALVEEIYRIAASLMPKRADPMAELV